jgi:putative transcriptional regulator
VLTWLWTDDGMKECLTLKNYLKEARSQRGLSQAQLAEMVGVSRNTISSIETGQFNPTAKLALTLCIALDKKFEELFYF